MKKVLKILIIVGIIFPLFSNANNRNEAELGEAIYRWKKAIELNPNSFEAHNNLAVAFEQFGYFENALEEYEIAYKLSPNNLSIKSNIASFKESYKVK